MQPVLLSDRPAACVFAAKMGVRGKYGGIVCRWQKECACCLHRSRGANRSLSSARGQRLSAQAEQHVFGRTAAPARPSLKGTGGGGGGGGRLVLGGAES